MSGKTSVKCAKCGVTSGEDSTLQFHRFPMPSKRDRALKAKVWATYCFPDEDWSSDKSLLMLHAQHKMLCGKHFDDSSYTSNDRKRLNKFAIPVDAKNILCQLRQEQSNAPREALVTNHEVSTVHMDINAIASTSHCDKAAANTATPNNDSAVQDKEIPHILHTTTPRRRGILKEIELKKLQDLTPRKQKLYKRCRQNLSEILRLRQKLKKIKKCKRPILSSLSTDNNINEIMKSKLSSSFYLLLQSQLQNTSRKLAGRRWSLDDKVLALSIYKKSSSCYRLLRRLFCLPSASALKAILNKIPMICGINSQVMNTIKEIAQTRHDTENLCVIAFDEMAIRKNLSYNSRLDQVDGYQDHAGQGRSKEIASQALTFMAIGVRTPWKQPIAFYFSGACVTADRLAVLIKEVLSACFSAGLIVVGTVCDCDGANIRAINILGASKDHPYFEYEGHEIITILDPPHLLKCFRNNFMKHDIQFTQDIQIDGKKTQGIAKWSHIKDFYDLDKQNPNFALAPKLSEEHLLPNGKQKMKVRLAAQVLSHSVASGLYAKACLNQLPQDAVGTATVVADIDKLFDSMNGDSPYPKNGKPFLTNISSSSPHLGFFQKMKCFFNEMKFLGARCKPPSQEGWLRTLNGLERLVKNLKKNHNIHSLSVKRISQDPLENCFGCIRSYCGSNPNPNTGQFIAALKTSIITSLINNNKSRNCLDDNNDILSNFKTFLTKEETQETETTDTVAKTLPIYEETMEEDDSLQCSSDLQACTYVCGFILKTMNVDCDLCKNVLLAEPNTEATHLFTSFKEFDEKKNRLKYVQRSFSEMVESAATIIYNFLESNSHRQNIKNKLCELCSNINTDWLNGCEKHKKSNASKIVNCTINICVRRFCTLKNRQFVEEAAKKSLKKKINILKHV